jgi:hypothetical protein
MKLILVSVFVVCILGTTSDQFFPMKFSLDCFFFSDKEVSESSRDFGSQYQ